MAVSQNASMENDQCEQRFFCLEDSIATVLISLLFREALDRLQHNFIALSLGSLMQTKLTVVRSRIPAP